MIDKNQIRNLFNQRKKLRKEKKFPEADEIRRKIESMGYIVTDWESETKFELKNISQNNKYSIKKSFLLLFGSGELSSIGRNIHEFVFKEINKNPINISIITTPAGFQPNVVSVHTEIADFFRKSLKNYHPKVSII